MRLLILWAGIAAFVWIGLHPPMTSSTGLARIRRYSIDQAVDIPVVLQGDVGCLLGRWGAVVALTGGLLYTERRLTPWARDRLRRTAGWAPLGVLLLCIIALCGVWAIQVINAGQDHSAFYAGQQEGVASIAGQSQVRFTPDVDHIMASIPERTYTAAESDTMEREETIVRRQINAFFAADNMRAYRGLYGKVLDPDGYWADLMPGQKANRMKVCDHAQLILDGAALSGEQVSVEEALLRAHLEVAARDGK